MATKQDIGRRGETVAAAYLQSIGYRLYARNTRLSHDELDIIAYDPAEKVVVFVEVKTRRRASADYVPHLGYGARKQARILRAARRWVGDKSFDGGYRVDLVCIVGDAVTDHVREINGGR